MPTCTRSWALQSWLKVLTRLRASSPISSLASSGLTARWVPQPKITVTFSSFTPAAFNSASTGKSISSLGALRVASSTTMATLLSGLAISLKRFEAIGSFNARSTSAFGSKAPSRSIGSIEPSRFLAETRTQTSVFP